MDPDIPEALYDEAALWLDGGERVELNVSGCWIEVARIHLDRVDGIVKGYTAEDCAVWFALSDLKAIREVKQQGLS